jgi:hypothetical protein
LVALEVTGSWAPLGLLTSVAIWLLVSPMLSAQFGPIDDYEIVAMLGPTRHLTLPDLIPSMAAWIGSDIHRVRPLRWVLRFIEAYIWGDNATGWYFDRLVLAGFTVIATAALAAKYVARPIAALAGLLLLVGLQSEIWYRLGPQETYAVPLFMAGLALIVYGHAWGLALVVLAALTKEAFVPMALLAAAWAWWLGHRWAAVLAAGITIAIGASVAYVLATRGEPFGQARNVDRIFEELLWMLRESARVTAWPIFVGFLIALDRRLAAIAVVVCLAIVLPQAVLDVDMRAGRYMIPASLGAILVTAAGLVVLARRWRPIGLAATYAVAALVIPSLVVQANAASASAADTRAFHSGIVALEAALAAHPDAVLVVRAADLWDIEPVGAIRTYIPNRRAMLIAPQKRSTPPMSDAIQAVFDDRAVHGGYGYEAWSEPASCVEADLHIAEPVPVCGIVVVVTGWTIP